MASPKPLPDKIKNLRGTSRKDRSNPSQPVPKAADSIPDAPQYWNKYAKEEWYRVTAELQAIGILHEIDLSIIQVYCYNWGLWCEASRTLEEEGKTIMMQNKGGGVYPIKSPWIAIKSDAEKALMKLTSEFGFSPASRTRISAPKKEGEKDPLKSMFDN